MANGRKREGEPSVTLREGLGGASARVCVFHLFFILQDGEGRRSAEGVEVRGGEAPASISG